MNTSHKFIVYFLWIVTLYVAGIFIFTGGFLLKRLAIESKSVCNVDFSTQSDQHSHGDMGCWTHRRFKKAIILVIDALRYDFVAFNNRTAHTAHEMPFENKLNVINDLLLQKPKNARLYHFMADPPTTTLQRLKGLTTGSLPTFVDAGKNFAGSEITEDNFIDQLIDIGKIIIFAGDDTWTGLYPNRFYKSHPFPSLNVKDLNSVDNGVIKHLIPEMKKKYWDVLLGHFLGVDHCGHTYGPDHPAMATKLVQMDDVLRSVVKEMKPDTVLFVLGDHGMTRTGDHGGDSNDELDAALFVYSPTQITSSPLHREGDNVVSQVDLVPTISLLLGSPIPFSNLGTIITDLFNYCPWWETDTDYTKQVYHTVKALRLNANQVHNYMKAYHEVSDEFPIRLYTELDELFRRSESELRQLVTALQLEGNSQDFLPKLETLQSQYLDYLARVKTMCHNIWAKFDLKFMFVGICVVFLALLLNLWLLLHIEIGKESQVSIFVALIGSVGLALFFGFLMLLSFGLFGLILCSLSGIFIFCVLGFVVSRVLSSDPNKPLVQKSNMKGVESSNLQGKSLLSKASTVLVIVYMASFFSNSFVVYEDLVASFITKSLLFVAAFETAMLTCSASCEKQKSNVKTSTYRFDIGKLMTSPVSILLFLTMICCAVIRFASNFFSCREEQWTCELSQFLQSLSAITDDLRIYKKYKYFFTIASVLVLPFGLYRFAKYYGNLNGHSPAVICASYTGPVSMVCACLYWAIQALPQTILENIPAWQVTLLPRTVYLLSVISITLLFFYPLSIYVVFRKTSDSDMSLEHVQGMRAEDIVARVYNHVKVNWRKHLLPQYSAKDQSENKPPLVYGLGTVYSSMILIVIFNLLPVLLLLLGDAAAPAITLQIVSSLLFLELHAAQQSNKSPETKLTVSWGSICLWNFMACVFFFGSGHQSTITSVRWESAYVGFSGDHTNFIIPAIMIVFNTFSSYIISIFTMPLLLLWPYFRGHLIFMFEKKRKLEHTDQKGEFFLRENEEEFRTAMSKLTLACLLFYGCRVFSTMLAAGHLRRHLMVWKIFAPRFVFEGATFLLVTVLLLLVYLFVLRIDCVLRKWANSLEN